MRAPPSKSVTHRAVVAASLSNGTSKVLNPLRSRDTLASVEACRKLGATIKQRDGHWQVTGTLPCDVPDDVIDVENSGTTMRLVTATSSLTQEGHAVLTGDESIRTRPMGPLIDSLRELGANCWSTRKDGTPPVVVEGGTARGGDTDIRGDISSQFVSALLVASPALEDETTVAVDGSLVSKPYVDMTIQVLEAFDIEVKEASGPTYSVPAEQDFEPTDLAVPGDFSSSALLLAASVMGGSELTVTGLDFDITQGDVAILEILREMGAHVEVDRDEGAVTVEADGLEGREFDLRMTPDLLPVVAVLALTAEGTTRIVGVEHAREKESDRVSNLARGLSRFGASVEETEDGLVVDGGRELRGAEVDPRGDHRIFMALCAAAVGASEPSVVHGVQSADVSYPGFLDDLRRLGLEAMRLDW